MFSNVYYCVLMCGELRNPKDHGYLSVSQCLWTNTLHFYYPCTVVSCLSIYELFIFHLYSTDTLTVSILDLFESITKTYLYYFTTPRHPTKPHFYIVKLGFTGVYIIFFLFLLKTIECGYSLEPPCRGGYNEYSQSML